MQAGHGFKLLVIVVVTWGLIGFGQAQLPDLVVADIAISPTSFGAGELVSFRATVTNRGEAPVETGFTVSFFADGQAAGNARVQPPLAPGEERAVTVLWVATGTPRAVQVEVDSRDEIDEANEENNGLERPLSGSTGAAEWTELYGEDFEDEQAQGWQLAEGDWEVVEDTDGNRVLRGREHNWARYTEESWGDFAFKLRVKLIRGSIHLNYRVSGCKRYFIGFHEEGIYLNKTSPCDRHIDLVQRSAYHRRGQWHAVEIKGRGGQIEIFVNGQRLIRYSDPDPLTYGSIALETLDDSEVYLDDLEVWGARSPTVDLAWRRTGGPLGGLGYDVRMHSEHPDRMYVTDAWAGVFLSEDGGKTWFPSNEGITTRVGPSGDAIPVFSLTIDPHDPETIWIGTQDVRGIFKSTDGGRTWQEMDEGVQERFGITFRGFTVDPRSSAIVYAAAELSSHAWAGEPRPGREFDLTKGVVYKTTDGGAHWEAVWRGDNLARYVWINPDDPEVVYVSTGIFDREAANSDPQVGRAGGVGIIKSTDGGRTWRQINSGLRNLYVGTLFMHPEDPEVLLAGTGNNQYHANNGVYRTTTGGDSWTQTLRGENITSVEFAASDPDIAYAGSVDAVYRSADSGRTWTRVSGGRGGWGPPGVRAGFPIDFQVDPRDPDRLFVNNYGGGNFVSEDGGRTWAIASDGYTGAQVRDIAVSENGRVMAAARSGIYASDDRGEDWTGFSYPPAASMEWYVVAFDPTDPEHVLAANNWERALLESEDGGRHWRPRVSPRRGNASWRAIAFAPSDPEIVYAGASAFFSAGTFDDEMPANGVYVSSDGGRSWRACNDGVSLDANVIDLAVSPNDPSSVYAATGNHGVLKSDDGGDHWQPLSRGLPDAPALTVEIDPTDPQVIFAGFRQNGLYRSDDRGASWRSAGAGMNPEASVTDLIFDPQVSELVYAADQQSGVFRSEDGGRTWVAMNHELRTRAVNALALLPDGKVLYAATEGEGVYRVRLSGQDAADEMAWDYPIIDSHVHIWPTTRAENRAYIDDLIEVMDRSGVERIALGLHARHLEHRPPTYSEAHDDWVLNAYERYPDRIIPMLGGFDAEDPRAVDYVREQLETGLWKGIGELDLRNRPKETTTPGDHPILMEIYGLAAEHDVPILFHYDECYRTSCANGQAEMERVMAAHPETIFIWGHGCPIRLMLSHDNLYCEYEYDFPAQGSLPRMLSDRVLLGTDVQAPDLQIHIPEQSVHVPYQQVIGKLRAELEGLAREGAERVAHENARRLFNLK